MVNICKCPHASSSATDLLRLKKRSKAAPPCEQHVVRLQVSNVPARNYRTTGVQGAPKSLTGSIVRNVGTQYLRPKRQVNLKAYCWRCWIEMSEKANAIL
jgi:hypothetical protein